MHCQKSYKTKENIAMLLYQGKTEQKTLFRISSILLQAGAVAIFCNSFIYKLNCKVFDFAGFWNSSSDQFFNQLYLKL